MSLNLPDRASYEYLKKLAKERLAQLRLRTPDAQLADAQLAVAREYGFASWRALKAELDRRRAPAVSALTRACAAGDVATIHGLLQRDPALVRERLAGGTTAIHVAVAHADAVRLLLEHGADPNARDLRDNATPLHFAAATGALDTVRLLLDAGADVHAAGDSHESGVIGWAAREDNKAVVDLLIERGAHHHIFSAMALRDQHVLERLVEADADCLLRRRSRLEDGQTPVHAAFAPPDGRGFLAGRPDYEMLQLLIDLGADIDATDGKGRTPLALAMLRGDSQAMRLLRAAGAKDPTAIEPQTPRDARAETMAAAASVKKMSPMLAVPDTRATVRWYQSLGFTAHDEYEDDGELVFARLTFGGAEFTLTRGVDRMPRDVSLWFFADRIQELYDALRKRQLAAASQASDGLPRDVEIRFEEDLYTPFYGGRQFSIRDVNGVALIFWQPEWLGPGGA